jgi:hypothetical protein
MRTVSPAGTFAPAGAIDRELLAIDREPLAADLGRSTLTRRQYSPTEMFMAEHGDFMLNRDTWHPDIEVRVHNMSDAEIKSEAGSFSLRYATVRADQNFYVDPNTYLAVGIDTSLRDYSFSNSVAGAHDNTLYRASASLGFGYFFDPAWLLEADFQPGVYSDFNGTLHHGDWQFHASTLATWRYAEDLFFKVGVERTDLFRDLDAYPLAGLTWLIEKDSWRVDLLLPRQARLTYQTNASTSFNFSVDLDGAEYRIRHPQNSSGARRRINVQEMEVSLGAEHRMDKRFSLHARVGSTLLGDYNWRDNTANRYSGMLEPEVFAEVGFGLTF